MGQPQLIEKLRSASETLCSKHNAGQGHYVCAKGFKPGNKVKTAAAANGRDYIDKNDENNPDNGENDKNHFCHRNFHTKKFQEDKNTCRNGKHSKNDYDNI